jgi:branched-chain amino acid transport system substrate-binding protein
LNSRWMAASGCLIAAFAVGVSACGGDDSSGGGGSDSGSSGGKTLNIYSSLPMQGASRTQTTALTNGIKLALEQAGSKAGNFTLKYTVLDDSTAQAGSWTPEATQANARKVAQDDNAAVYIGEFNSGASAISIPILNEAGVLQVSPSNTATGLTRSLGADKGEPDKYYPSGKRTYGRVVPADHIQGAAQVSYQKDNGCTKSYLLNDKEVYGAGLAKNVVVAAKAQGLTIVGNTGIDPKAANYRSVAGTIKASGADCVFFGGITDNNGVQLFKDLHAAMPSAKLFGPDGVAETAFFSKLGSSVEKAVYITNPTLDPKLYPASGQEFFKNYKAKYGADPEAYAIYGYEAMGVLLQAIKDAGDKGNDRASVIAAFYKIKNRESVLGTYSIDENGDTTLSDYGGDRVVDGKLVFDKVIKAQTAG